jgi:hypothetical protein
MADYRNAGILNTDGSGTVNIGLSDNNPGDLKCCDGNNWQGLVGNDGTFDTFSDTIYGLRALALDLTTKINVDKLTTISAIISAYAPASDSNDVNAYISSVVSDTGFSASQILSANPATLQPLVRAIVNHEIGDTLSGQYISDADIAQAVGMISSGSPAMQQASAAAENNPGMTAMIITGVVGLGIWLTR